MRSSACLLFAIAFARLPATTAAPVDGAPASMPSVRVDDSLPPLVSRTRHGTETLVHVRNRLGYGGKGDKLHLGGFSAGMPDHDGLSPQLWSWMVRNFTARSVVDVGCGKGISTSWFHTHGLRTLCVEGSHDAVQQTLMPPQLVVEHDFTRGPWCVTARHGTYEHRAVSHRGFEASFARLLLQVAVADL